MRYFSVGAAPCAEDSKLMLGVLSLTLSLPTVELAEAPSNSRGGQRSADARRTV